MVCQVLYGVNTPLPVPLVRTCRRAVTVLLVRQRRGDRARDWTGLASIQARLNRTDGGDAHKSQQLSPPSHQPRGLCVFQTAQRAQWMAWVRRGLPCSRLVGCVVSPWVRGLGSKSGQEQQGGCKRTARVCGHVYGSLLGVPLVEVHRMPSIGRSGRIVG